MSPDTNVSSAPLIPEGLVRSITAVSRVNDDRLRSINEWAKSNLEFILGADSDDRDAHESLSISRQEFVSALNLIGNMIFGNEDGPSDPERYIQVAKEKASNADIDKLRILLGGISPDQKKVSFARQRTLALQAVIPTLEQISCVCDLRAIFQRPASPSVNEKYVAESKILLGFEPVAVVSISTSDATGDDQVSTIQLTERGLASMLRTLEAVSQQMKLLKEANSSAR